MSQRQRRGFGVLEQNEVWRQFHAGHSQVEIARDLGRHDGSVRGFVSGCGGVRPVPRTRAARVLSSDEREMISRGVAVGESVRAIARQLGRAPSTISREIARHGNREQYRAVRADRRAWERARRPKPCRLATQPVLCAVVAAKLAQQWSPTQIAGWLAMTHPTDPTMHVSPETIYRSLYMQARGVLKRELQLELRRHHLIRRSQRANTAGSGRGQIVGAVSIAERPASIEDRAIPGHWEGDLLAGSRTTYIATLVERASRYVHLVKVPNKDTQSVVTALLREVRHLPHGLLASLTWDRGHELAQHARFTMATDVAVYFCDPRSPWQRGSNENTNGLLRQYFPKGTNLAQYSQADLNAVALRLNTRPRKTLGFRTPAQVLDAYVASTG